MCVYCEIPSTNKDAFFNEHPELEGNDDILRLQINIVGDPGSGKTSLIQAYGAEQFPPITAVSRYACYKLMKVNNKPAQIILYDTIGLEGYNDPHTRSLMFKFSEVTILCYSINSRESFTNISSQWFPEITASETKNPVLLVGLKKELRCDKPKQTHGNIDSECVSFNEGNALAKSIGASAFMECSSLTGEAVSNVFEIAIKKSNIFKEYNEKKGKNRQSWRYLCCFNT